MADIDDDPSDDDWAIATFVADIDAAANARRALPRLLSGTKLTHESYANLELLVSELVTNAVAHTGTDRVGVSIRLGNPIRVCVIDGGDGDPRLTDAAVGGWGLRLVEALAADWGVLPLRVGKAVWFDLD